MQLQPSTPIQLRIPPGHTMQTTTPAALLTIVGGIGPVYLFVPRINSYVPIETSVAHALVALMQSQSQDQHHQQQQQIATPTPPIPMSITSTATINQSQQQPRTSEAATVSTGRKRGRSSKQHDKERTEEEAKMEEDESDLSHTQTIALVRPKKHTKRMKHGMKVNQLVSQGTDIEPLAGPPLYQRPSPAQRCDANSLSIIFSFLMNKEFSSALQVNHVWCATAQMNTAWPEFQLESFIQQLESENYSGAGQRRLRLVNELSKGITSALNHPIMKRANDIILGSFTESSLLQLTQFPYLTALNGSTSCEVDTSIFTGLMKDRLRVLILCSSWNHKRPFATIHELTSLRVLVTDFPIQTNQLEQLKQLEFLHINHSYALRPQLIQTFRWLSVYHSLRHVSIRGNYARTSFYMKVGTDYLSISHTQWNLVWNLGVTRIESPNLNSLAHLSNPWEVEGEAVPPARLTHFGLTMTPLEQTHLCSLLSMPDLQQLDCEVSPLSRFTYHEGSIARGSITSNGLSRLVHLNFRITTSTPFSSRPAVPVPASVQLPALRHCASVKRLYLATGPLLPRAQPQRHSCQLTIEAQYCPQLEDLTVAYPLILTRESIEMLSICKHLRRLDLSNRPNIDLDLVAPILSQLSEFQILEVTVWPPESDQFFQIPPSPPFILPERFMQYVSQSTSWSSLHLHLSDDHLYEYYENRPRRPWSIEPSQLTLRAGGTVDPGTVHRFRLQTHSSDGLEPIYRVVTNYNNQQSWCEI